ncbi:hypothetical protein [Sphingobium sp. MP9-4]|uniref:hypothetical protein n=1 Tax=Sphingobium sp. MP9-4 TaxID=1761936 RepID=UPI0010CA6B42|nr:hypothetical protein [Sphingobium sp. MP9-4]
MHGHDDAAYFRHRELQELATAERISDPLAKRLHWEMAQQYAARARLNEEGLQVQLPLSQSE